jgi:hypothetical protein
MSITELIKFILIVIVIVLFVTMLKKQHVMKTGNINNKQYADSLMAGAYQGNDSYQDTDIEKDIAELMDFNKKT